MTDIKKALPLPKPDYNSIKAELKEFLKGQDELKDYDFESPTITVLLDMLAANSFFNSFYLNQVGNESFLQTAVKRDSVAQRAAALGYFPKSARASTALLFLELASLNSASYVDIPANTIFLSKNNNQTFTFRTMDTYRVFRNSDGRYLIDNVEIIEGKLLTHTFSVGQEEIKNGVVIPNINVDTSKLRVDVRENTISSAFVEYEPADSALLLDGEDQVYYLREDDGGLVRVVFGDGILGKSLVQGGEVRITYIISSGPVSNGIGSFSMNSAIPNSELVELLVTSAANGGSYPESIESIKFRAPKSYEAQGRAVTDTDYEEILRQKYSSVKDVKAWGGQTIDPPQYGKVFIAVVPEEGYFITDSEKERIKEIIKKYNVVTVTPVIVDADYIFIRLNTTVRIDPNQTDLEDGAIKAIVSSKIQNFNDEYLNKFSKSLRYSVLSRVIDFSEPSVVSSTTSYEFSKNIFARTNQPQDFIVQFNNQIDPGTVLSSRFTYNGYTGAFFEDTGSGSMNIYAFTSIGKVLVASDAASIDYSTGTIEVSGFEVTDLGNLADPLTGQKYIRFSATPVSLDVEAGNRQIIVIENSQVNIVRDLTD